MKLLETVSDSEVSQHNRCERAHLYGYGYGLSPKRESDPLEIGKLFHEMIAAYNVACQSYMAGGEIVDWEDCVDAGLAEGIKACFKENRYREDIHEIAQDCYLRFVYEDTLDLDIIAVEDYIEYQLSDTVVMNGVIDLVARVREVKRNAPKWLKDLKGKLVIIDYKTCYNFFTLNELTMHVQIPKYVLAANRTNRYGEKIEGAIISQIRWRDNARQISKLDPVDIDPMRITGIVDEHLKTAERIIEKRQTVPPYDWGHLVTRTLNKDICKNCSFLDLCNAELRGDSKVAIEQQINHDFKPRDTSYRKNRKKNAA